MLSPLIPLVVGIRRRFSLLWCYVFAGLCFDILIAYLKRVAHMPFFWVADIFVVVEFVMISCLYRNVVYNKSRWFYIVTAAYCVFFVLNTLSKPLDRLNTLGASIAAFTFMVYAITGFYTILQKQKILFLEKSSFFWTNVAFLLYASGNLLLFLFNDYLREFQNELFVLLWVNVFRSLNVVKNVLLAFALSPKTVNK